MVDTARDNCIQHSHRHRGLGVQDAPREWGWGMEEENSRTRANLTPTDKSCSVARPRNSRAVPRNSSGHTMTITSSELGP